MRATEQWIWLDPKNYPERQQTLQTRNPNPPEGRYAVVEFRREYRFDAEVESAALRFSGDSSFQLYCNGDFLASGPASVGGDFYNCQPMRPQYYATCMTVHPSGNVLSFYARVRMCPEVLFEISHGHGGFYLWAEVRLADGSVEYLMTDNSWECRLCGAYVRPGLYDGRIAPDSYQPAAIVPNIWHTEDSPLPPVTEKKIPVPDGEITLKPGETLDCVRELDKIYAAYPAADVQACGEVELTLRCFETDDGGTEEHCIFAGTDSYRSARLHSIGGYRVHAENRSDSPAVIRLFFVASHYPVTVCARTHTDDEEMNRVLDVCRHTLQYCRQTLHLDSPRHCEPMACTGDYYIETLMTAFSFGDMTLAAFDVRRTAELIRYQNGVMFHTTYSLIWVQMLWDVYMLTGEKSLLEDCMEALCILLRQFRTYVGENELVDNPRDFMFVDWIYIDGLSMHHPPKALGQTCLNAFYYGALMTAEKIFRCLGESTMADRCSAQAAELRAAVNNLLYDPERGLYFEGLNTPTPEHLVGKWMPQNVEKRYYLCHSNILCTRFGLCEREDARRILRQVLTDASLGRCQPYFAHYLLESVYENGLREECTRQILEDWKAPVRECPKGLVEGFIKPEPTYHFDHSHAWGGTPLYALPKALTGFSILEPGCGAVALSPSLLGMREADVEIPLPQGMLTVKMRNGEPPQITVPDGVRVELR